MSVSANFAKLPQNSKVVKPSRKHFKNKGSRSEIEMTNIIHPEAQRFKFSPVRQEVNTKLNVWDRLL